MRRTFWDFLSRAAQAGPQAIIFVYLSGRGLQYQGENYFAPIGAAINRVGDAPTEALRVSDFTQALASMPLRAQIFVLDAAREHRFAPDEQPCGNRFAPDGQPFAGGLALVEAAPGALYAFNAAPGTIAPNESAPYGAYAKALAEMLRVRGIPIDEAFSRARLRVNEVTRGAFVPWDTAELLVPVVLLPATPDASAPVAAPSYASLRARPIREFPAMEAYSAAIERDTLEGYEDFLAAYPDDRLAVRVRALLAARREALTWRRAIEANTPNAYWSYKRRYPHGPHFADARYRLIRISAPPEPPPRFDAYDFVDVPPPPVEYVIVDRPVIVFSIIFSNGYPPLPPPPVYFLPPQPVAFVDLAPPPPLERGSLPIPVPISIPGAPIAPQTRCADGSTSDLRGSGVCSHHGGAASEAQGQAKPPPAAPIPTNGHALPPAGASGGCSGSCYATRRRGEAITACTAAAHTMQRRMHKPFKKQGRMQPSRRSRQLPGNLQHPIRGRLKTRAPTGFEPLWRPIKNFSRTPSRTSAVSVHRVRVYTGRNSAKQKKVFQCN